ncbi:PREDICTED: uncharacterized protein LOC106337818 [Brassica oleracea var. oleracea]|uniref:uncharacterized protein LOC106337818 n=1 Tax=Brassica oleracea var. oleracea TaxID=109376 RepID=UPI0006A74140|nr:PREDICTED: uncharacterized protein LOC106337818 [Brassica oleracea var. oleracea]
MGQTSAEGNLDDSTLALLIEMIDEHNCLAKIFRRARDHYENVGSEFAIRLLPDKGKGKEYNLPSTSEVAEIPLLLETGTSRTRQFLTIRQYYASQIQTRPNQGMTLIKGGRLLHQFIVDVYTTIEEDRLREYGNPDLFITMTANPNWSEIKEHLGKYGGDSPNDRPYIECRVFKMKLDQLLKDFKVGTFFKPYTAALHQIEFQKRGLPHAHILLWIGNSTRTPSAEEVDKIISAELPNKEEDPVAYSLVTKHMIHGPCGLLDPKSPCMENNVCTKKYPRPYNNNTSIDKSGYVLYRRRRNDDASTVKAGAVLDNTFVVPHNIKLLKKYEAHINVEWCNRTSAVKYLFKYITKGVDRETTVIENGNTSATSDATGSGGSKEKVVRQRNEIQDYIEARYLSACESMWRTFAFHIHKRKSSVEKLIIHLEGEHNITITVKSTDNLGRVIRKPGIEKTMFTEWMVLCRRSAFAQTLTYVQIPEYFVWNNSAKVWTERKKGKTIGRVVAVHPSAGDRYYLRILINKIKGPRSYDELKTYNDVKYPDFKSVCQARGYLDNDVEWLESMSEGARTATPYQLRDLFVTFLNNCFVASHKGLWEHSWKSMSEDILHKRQRILGHANLELDDKTLEQYTLIEVEKLMHMQDRSLNDIKDMPKINPVLLKELGNSLWNQEMDYDLAEETLRHDKQYNLLNAEQLAIYGSVLDSVDKKEGKIFFVYGAGGTGKTFLYQTIISRLRSRKQIVLPVASSGIATLLLPNGRTAHSCFNIPLKLEEDKLCNIKPGTMLAELIEETDLIIWDEAPMTHKHAFEALDKSLKDIMSMKNPPAKNQPFGGKTVMLGGDFRQTLPVIPQGSRADSVLASISHSYLWNSCHKFSLKVSRDYFSLDSFELSNTTSDQNDTLYSVEYLLCQGGADVPVAELPGVETHQSADDGQLAPWIVWALWTARNKLIFNNKMYTAEEVITHAVAAAREWLNAQSKEQRHSPHPQASRTTSPREAVIQTDAAWKIDTRTTGLGWSIRKTGETLNFQSVNCFVSSPLIAEGLAMREAVKKCKELGLRHIRLESDSAQLIKALRSKLEPPEIYAIISDIRINCLAFETVYFAWIPRAKNSVDDGLAKQALALYQVV